MQSRYEIQEMYTPGGSNMCMVYSDSPNLEIYIEGQGLGLKLMQEGTTCKDESIEYRYMAYRLKRKWFFWKEREVWGIKKEEVGSLFSESSINYLESITVKG